MVVVIVPNECCTKYEVAPGTAFHAILAVVELFTALTKTVTDPGDALLDDVLVPVGDEFAGAPLLEETE